MMKKSLWLLLILFFGIFQFVYAGDAVKNVPNVTNPAFSEDVLDNIYGFLYGSWGQLSTNPKETIEGRRSVVGKYQGSASYNQILFTDPYVLPLHPKKTYTVRFRYKILDTPDKGFEVGFYSPTGGAANQWLPGKRFQGVTGDQGEISLTSTLGSYDDYQVAWNIVGQGAIAIDSVSLFENTSNIPIVTEGFEGHNFIQGRLPFKITDTKILPLGAEGLLYVLRSANVRDLDGDGSAEAFLTITTYGEQLPHPVIILGAKSGVADLTELLFPQGVPKVKHSPYTLFPDLDGDGKADIVFSEAGLDHEPWTGARVVIALQDQNGCFRDISDKIPKELWNTKSYATAVGDLDGDGRPEVLFPDELDGKKTMLLIWKNDKFVAKRNWISQKLWNQPEELRTQNSVEIADLDNDGWQDIIVGGRWVRPNLRLVFGGPKGFPERNLLTLPDGVFGHTAWEKWQQKNTLSAQGADNNGLVVADLDNDGLKDIFSIQEQVLNYKPGVITDTQERLYRQIYDQGGTIYANTALQVYKNEDKRKFVDITPTTTGFLGHRYYLALIPIDLNGDGFLDIIGGYWTKPYGTQKENLYGSTVFLNDGTGVFQVVEGSKLFPTKEAIPPAAAEHLGIFLPTRLVPGRLEGLFLASKSTYRSGYLIARKGVYEGAIGTGPNLSDSAKLGFPGYNEYYYLRTHPDAQSTVLAGLYANGLEHYKAIGIRRGYQAFAANTTIHGSEGHDTLILAIDTADAQISKVEGGWQLIDTTGKYGTLQIGDVESIQFRDGVKNL